MAYEFEVSGRISKPVGEVFEAVVNPERLSSYFTTGGANGRLVPGVVVNWEFHDFPGAFPVHVVHVDKDRRIVLRWEAAPDDDPAGTYETTVTMTFAPLEDGRTLVTIAETGFRNNKAAQKASYGNCEGWTGMLCAMKVYLEHGISLRQGFYR
ncbi:MAG: SRPBCC domain-containing protein [Pseudorhizobium sp.]